MSRPAESDNRGPQIVAVSISMIILSTAAVTLRIWGRFVGKKAGLGWDDYLSLSALPFVIAISALSIYWASLGLDFLYNTGLTLIKLSVVILYARIFGNVEAYRVALWIAAVLITGWCIAIDGLALFTCVPIQRSWDPDVPGHCLNTAKDFLGAAIPNISIDVLLLILPMPMLWRLNASNGRKVGLTAVFAAGYLVLVLSILRVAFIARLGLEFQEDITCIYQTIVTLVDMRLLRSESDKVGSRELSDL